MCAEDLLETIIQFLILRLVKNGSVKKQLALSQATCHLDFLKNSVFTVSE